MTAEPGPDTLVSIGLPVRNAADRVAGVIRSVLAQDHGRIELVMTHYDRTRFAGSA